MFLVRFLFRNLKGYRLIVVISIVITFARVGAEIFSAFPIKFIPDRFINCLDPGQFKDPKTSLVTSSWASDLLNPLITPFDQIGGQQPDSEADLQACQHSLKSKNLPFPQHTKIGVTIFSVLMLLVLSLLGATVTYIQFFLASSIVDKLSTRLREQLFEHLQRLSLNWHGRQKKGDLVQRVTGNVADIEKFATEGLTDWLGGILTVIGIVTVMSAISLPYTLFSLAIAPVLSLVLFIYTNNINIAARKAAKAAGQIADVAVEDIGAITELKAFTLEDREIHRFRSYVGKYSKASFRTSVLQAQFTPIVSILVGIGTIVIVSIGAIVAEGSDLALGFITIPAGSISFGTMVLFFIYFGRLYQSMRDVSRLTSLTNSATAGAERIQEVLDEAPEVIESKIHYTGPIRLRGEISFENVVFGYTPERPVLKGINLHIPAGKKVALVGFAGGGKTTLVKLIPRFYEVTQGSVKIDGWDNRLYPLSVLRRNVGMVLQESVLFEGTVLENLKIGRPDATMEEVIDAARQAQIHDTIMNMPDSYNTMVRSQGKNFSGGQRQRIAIARAILSRAPILILDEPTVSLDVEAEAEVMNALDKLVVGRTVLMISHRLSTLGQVDEIIVLMDGRIVERGTYKELRRTNGVFAGMLKEQNRYAENYDDRQHAQSPLKNSESQASLQKARVSIEVDGRIIDERFLDKPELTVGRRPDCDLSVPSKRVSPRHAKIRWVNRAWHIEDAESLTGLIYEGQRIDHLVLKNGDLIFLTATVAIRFETII